MSRSKLNPPFRADHVGSLLRPEQVLQAREQAANGEITPGEQRHVEDDAIAGMIPKLQATGIQSITHGEYRRAWLPLDFPEQLDGVTVTGMIASSSDSEGRVGMAPPKITVTGKLAHKKDIQVADYQFVDAHTDRLPKVALPSPTMALFRGGRAGIDELRTGCGLQWTAHQAAPPTERCPSAAAGERFPFFARRRKRR